MTKPTPGPVLLGVLLLLALPALAGAATLSGKVRHATSQEPVPGVVVTASPVPDGVQPVVTDAEGRFQFPELPAGTYALRFEKESFEPAQKDVTLDADSSLPLEVMLAPRLPPATVERTSPDVVPSTGVESIGVPRPVDPRTRAPAWALPYLPILIPDGTSQLLYRSPVPERTWGREGASASRPDVSGYGVNPTIDTEEERFSSFPVDVDTAAYAQARGALERDVLPDPQTVRVEAFINSFDYSYEAHASDPFSVHVEGFPSPSRKGYHVVRVGLKAREVGPARRKPLHLTLVVDTSQRMSAGDRLGLVKEALRSLVEALDARDQVALVTYDSAVRPVLPRTPVSEKQVLLAAIDGLRAGEPMPRPQGGLAEGYGLAEAGASEDASRRVILLSSGLADSGLTDADPLWARVKGNASRGVTLSTIGFGTGSEGDELMERLALVGEGVASTVDRPEAAREVLVRELIGRPEVVARDVRVQLEFDRQAVARYRLVGYEHRKQGEEPRGEERSEVGLMVSGQSVTAIYEVKLLGPAIAFATLRVGYKSPHGGSTWKMEKLLASSLLLSAYGRAAPATRLAWVAAAFAEKLRGSYWTQGLSWTQLQALWAEVGEPLRGRKDVVELGALIRKAAALERRTTRSGESPPTGADDVARPGQE